MFCTNCGKELPGDANFCLKCGKPQKSITQLQIEEPKWETCEIHREEISNNGWYTSFHRFYISAIGPKGLYRFGDSAIWREHQLKGSEGEALVRAHRQTIEMLVKSGWEPTGEKRHGSNGEELWFADKFRRRIN